MRTEHDSMGGLDGAQAQQAVENIPISNPRLPRPIIWGMGLIKAAADHAYGKTHHLKLLGATE